MDCGNNYLLDVLSLIDKMQKNSTFDGDNSCLRPMLNNNTSFYNTRPVTFYLCNNSLLTVNYGDNLESSIFRIEKICDNCVTVRLLSQDETGTISATSEMATININCIAAIRCLNDINLTIL